jgi:DNA polymerase III delta prime subunit
MTTVYDADVLYKRLMEAVNNEAPTLIFSGPPGAGKSTVLAAVPVEKGKERRVYDHENSMKSLDGGLAGIDLYSRRHQRFRMNRKRFPKLEDYATLFSELKTGKHSLGAIMIDNIVLFQEQMSSAMNALCLTPPKLKELFGKFDVPAGVFPHDKIIMGWRERADAKFWDVLKQPFAKLLLACQRENVMFVGSTEEGNIWENYGQTGQRIIGKKAKVLDVWLRYSDGVIFLKRDANAADAPRGSINPAQPKMRLQGLNPSWVMDWPSFIGELEAAQTRLNEEIPAEARVSTDIVSDEPEGQIEMPQTRKA